MISTICKKNCFGNIILGPFHGPDLHSCSQNLHNNNLYSVHLCRRQKLISIKYNNQCKTQLYTKSFLCQSPYQGNSHTNLPTGSSLDSLHKEIDPASVVPSQSWNWERASVSSSNRISTMQSKRWLLCPLWINNDLLLYNSHFAHCFSTAILRTCLWIQEWGFLNWQPTVLLSSHYKPLQPVCLPARYFYRWRGQGRLGSKTVISIHLMQGSLTPGLGTDAGP